jgi:hypothetical protein
MRSRLDLEGQWRRRQLPAWNSRTLVDSSLAQGFRALISVDYDWGNQYNLNRGWRGAPLEGFSYRSMTCIRLVTEATLTDKM